MYVVITKQFGREEQNQVMSENTTTEGFDQELYNKPLVRTYKNIILAIIRVKINNLLVRHHILESQLQELFYDYCETWSWEGTFNPKRTYSLYKYLCVDAAKCFEETPEILEVFYTNLNALHSLVSSPSMAKIAP